MHLVFNKCRQIEHVMAGVVGGLTCGQPLTQAARD